MKLPIVICSACNGHGKTPLSPPLLEALMIIRKHGPITVPEIYTAIGNHEIVSTAINKRVAKLLQLKLVSRKLQFGATFYSAVK